MRWKRKVPKLKRGDWRIVTRFAFFPIETTLPDKTVIWLEFYKTNDQYMYNSNGYHWYTHQIAPKEYWRNN